MACQDVHSLTQIDPHSHFIQDSKSRLIDSQDLGFIEQSELRCAMTV